MLHGYYFWIMEVQKDWYKYGTIQVDYQTEEQYIVTIFLNIKVII